jgi:hypothetical protein
MRLKILLIVNAIVLGSSGILAILLPSAVLELYGVEAGPAVLLMAQYAGLGSLAIALLAWFSRNVNDTKAQYALVLAFLITYLAGVIISLFGTLAGTMRIGWAVVGIYLLFALLYAYMLITLRQRTSS